MLAKIFIDIIAASYYFILKYFYWEEMKTTLIFLAVLIAFTATAFAGAKSYKVTGPVLAVSNDVIRVQKDNEKWEINYDKTKIPLVKVGDKVTIK